MLYGEKSPFQLCSTSDNFVYVMNILFPCYFHVSSFVSGNEENYYEKKSKNIFIMKYLCR